MIFHKFGSDFVASCGGIFVLEAARVSSHTGVDAHSTEIGNSYTQSGGYFVDDLAGSGSLRIQQCFLSIVYVRYMVVYAKLNLIGVYFFKTSHKLSVGDINGYNVLWGKVGIIIGTFGHEIVSFRKFVAADDTASFSE
jgi:hypothetical protein